MRKMQIIGKLESDEGEKFRVVRWGEDRVEVQMFSEESKEWNEVWFFYPDMSDTAKMKKAREEAQWLAEGEVFPEQRWAERISHAEV